MSDANHTSNPDPRKTFGIYQIWNVATGAVYIGSTTQSFHQRWGQHKSLLRKDAHDNHRLQYSWDTWGESAFLFEIIEVVEDKAVVIQREQAALDTLRARGVELYNASGIVGNPMQGKRHTDETKEKIRRKALGRKKGPPWNKGVKASDEHRKAVREGIKMAFARPEIKENLRKGQIGRKHSEDSKRKRSLKLSGDSNPSKRAEVRAKSRATKQAKRLGDQITREWPVLVALSSQKGMGLTAREVLNITRIPDGSIWRMLRKLIRLDCIRCEGRHLHRLYSITALGVSKLRDHNGEFNEY